MGPNSINRLDLVPLSQTRGAQDGIPRPGGVAVWAPDRDEPTERAGIKESEE